jgi:TolA-binding protein
VSDYCIFPSAGAGVLRNTYGIPGILAEASFFTNPTEETRLKQENYNEKEAKSYLNALASFFEKPVPVIKPKQIPKAITPFKVFEEADRMNPIALEWRNDFINAEKLMKSNDTNDLRKAYDLFTRSAKSFPDSYLAQKAHFHRAELLKKLNKSSDAAMENKRAQEFYINLN